VKVVAREPERRGPKKGKEGHTIRMVMKAFLKASLSEYEGIIVVNPGNKDNVIKKTEKALSASGQIFLNTLHLVQTIRRASRRSTGRHMRDTHKEADMSRREQEAQQGWKNQTL
jgi:hypothetical protein